MIIGRRHKQKCAAVTTGNGHVINWVDKRRYLGVNITIVSTFGCDFGEHKRSFYGAFNPVYGRIGRCASEEVACELLVKKCIPLIYYASEVLPLNNCEYKSLDYVINSAFRKIFATNSGDIVSYCRNMFGVASAKDCIAGRRQVFLHRLAKIEFTEHSMVNAQRVNFMASVLFFFSCGCPSDEIKMYI